MAVDVVAPVVVDENENGNDTLIVIRPVDGSRANRPQPPADNPIMLSFQKLDVRRQSEVRPVDRQGEPITPTVSFWFMCTATITGPTTSTDTDIQGQALTIRQGPAFGAMQLGTRSEPLLLSSETRPRLHAPGT